MKKKTIIHVGIVLASCVCLIGIVFATANHKHTQIENSENMSRWKLMDKHSNQLWADADKKYSDILANYIPRTYRENRNYIEFHSLTTNTDKYSTIRFDKQTDSISKKSYVFLSSIKVDKSSGWQALNQPDLEQWNSAKKDYEGILDNLTPISVRAVNDSLSYKCIKTGSKRYRLVDFNVRNNKLYISSIMIDDEQIK